MPVACARKIEFLVRSKYPGLDIQLRPVVLTLDQCQEYELPRTPLKESEKRAGEFEARYGSGATELDALEALYPDDLRNILIEEIEQYRDPNLEGEIEDIVSDLDSEIDAANRAAAERFAQQIAELEAEQAALNERRNRLSQDMIDFLRDEAPDLSEVEWPVPDADDPDDDPLFELNAQLYRADRPVQGVSGPTD